jgi:hypothetical protein
MRTILTALVAAATLAGTTTGSPGAGLVDVTDAVVGSAAADVRPAYVAVPDSGYIVYSGYDGVLPGPNCFWTRMPVYDNDRTVIGWRGRPVAVCPQKRVSAQAGK